MNETTTLTDAEIVEQNAQQYARSAIQQRREQDLKARIEARFEELMAEAGIPRVTDADRLKAMTEQYLVRLQNADLDKRAQAAAQKAFEEQLAAGTPPTN